MGIYTYIYIYGSDRCDRWVYIHTYTYIYIWEGRVCVVEKEDVCVGGGVIKISVQTPEIHNMRYRFVSTDSHHRFRKRIIGHLTSLVDSIIYVPVHHMIHIMT